MNIPESTPNSYNLSVSIEFLGERTATPLETDMGRLATMPVILLGIPGAGKTTLSNELQAIDPNINYISLGDISRSLDPESAHRKELDRLFALGKPVGLPELFLDIVEPHIDRAIDRSGGFILDGIPKKEEEINPLLRFLAEKDANPELVISCEVSPMLAYKRIVDRSAREGDPDTMNIFLNRTKVYLRDLDSFKTGLTNDGEIPLLVMDTSKHAPEPAARAVIALAGIGSIEIDQGSETRSEQTRLYESLKSGNRADALRVIGPAFDDTLHNVDYGVLADPEATREDKQAYVEAAMLLNDPRLQETPKFLSRMAGNYIDTTLMSIEHIHDSLLEEVTLRHGEDFSEDHVVDVFSQQIMLKETIRALQEEIMSGHDLEALTEQEIQANLPELEHVENVLKSRAVNFGLNPDDISVSELMKLQPKLWGQLTSNKILFSPDLNYRRMANGIPGSHHSLLPFTQNKRALSANSMGEYIPFIEAVSATENEYSSTFGFIHFVGMDENGEAFGVEYPIMMHDRKLLSLGSPTVEEILKITDSFYFNHDLWHNMIPVYSSSFILHHPDAPLSFGGRLPAYKNFGLGMRSEKEEYEIGVAMSHARTQHERFAADPDVRSEQVGLLIDALSKLEGLNDELATKCTPEEIEGIVDYLASRIATKAYNVFPDDDPIYVEIKDRLHDLGVKPMELVAGAVADLLYMQGLLDPEKTENILATFGVEATEEIRGAISGNTVIANTLIKECVDTTKQDRESGAEFIVEALESWGVLRALSEEPAVELDVIQKSRWLAMVAPQRQQLKGHMEKVHGKPGYKFNDEILEDPRDLVLMQKVALDADKNEYKYRQRARQENQRLSYEIYSLMFNDDQDMHSSVRSAFDALRLSSDIGLRLFSKEAAGMLDTVMHELVANTYGDLSEELDYLESYADSIISKADADTGRELSRTIRSVVRKYQMLAEREREHQRILGIKYSNASQQLTDENMTIS